MTLAAQIAALPEWPKRTDSTEVADLWSRETRTAYAALARLAVAREWIAVTHLNGCSAGKWSMKTGRYEECDCGRDALLKAMEAP